MLDLYDEDYYERGLESGKSCYQNYRWIPELTIPLAMRISDLLGIGREKSILDFGCAKGYLVKAFRLLGRDAWGVDASKYAIENVDSKVKKFCMYPNFIWNRNFDFCVAKDVFEHIPKKELEQILKEKNKQINKLLAIIPLGENYNYRAPANNYDITHIICESEVWWMEFFKSCGWKKIGFSFKVDGIKEGYYEKFPKSHGFFLLRK